jgi:hypothetical protein
MRHHKIAVPATVRIESAPAGGKAETILVNSRSLPLYTLTDDQAGQVTGQGARDFIVATPGLARIGTLARSAAPAPAAPSGGYGY